MKILLVGLLIAASACTDKRVCSLDQSGFFHIKCWGSCPSADAHCKLRWRLIGTEDPWETNGMNYRDRDNKRDAELNYACFCK